MKEGAQVTTSVEPQMFLKAVSAMLAADRPRLIEEAKALLNEFLG
jgi:hypothetical protein